MNKVFSSELQTMADEIREQAAQLRVLTFLSFVYTADVINRYLDITLAKYPVGRTGFSVLHSLVLHGGTMTPTKLSERIFRSKHAITRVVDKLEELGFENGWVQEISSHENYRPDFEVEKPFI